MRGTYPPNLLARILPVFPSSSLDYSFVASGKNLRPTGSQGILYAALVMSMEEVLYSEPGAADNGEYCSNDVENDKKCDDHALHGSA
jgi:hypothetical protein